MPSLVVHVGMKVGSIEGKKTRIISMQTLWLNLEFECTIQINSVEHKIVYIILFQ